jgi:hypothetical protein
MAGFRIEGNTSGNVAEVDANNNLKITGPITEVQAGFAALSSEVDAGTVTGTRTTKALELSEDFRLKVGTDQYAFYDNFSASTSENRYSWTSVVTTMTTGVTNGFQILNAGSSVASGAVARFQTWQSFKATKQATLQAEMNIQLSAVAQTNNVCEWGFFIATGTAAPTDGVFFRINASGELRCVVNFNGTETQSSALSVATLISTNTTQQFLIYMNSKVARFWINNILVAEINLPVSQPAMTSSQSLPLAFRNYNSAATSTAQQMKIGEVSVMQGDMGFPKPYSHVMSSMGKIASQLLGGGTSALYTNSLAAGAGAAMTNTTAALGSGLGGQFTTTPTLAAGTDGILMSYQNIAGAAATQGRTLFITGIRVQGAVTAALTGGPVLYAYSLAYGHTNVSMATADAATAKAPRRIPLGFESFAATAAVGVIGQSVYMPFDAPVPVYQGELVAVVAKNLGTVTSAGTISVLVSVDGYWE